MRSVADARAWPMRFDAPWRHEVAGRFRTKYELKGYREGRRGHFFEYQRNDAPLAHPPHHQGIGLMPHLFLRSPLSAAEITERFQATRRQFGAVHIAILHAYADPKRNVAAL